MTDKVIIPYVGPFDIGMLKDRAIVRVADIKAVEGWIRELEEEVRSLRERRGRTRILNHFAKRRYGGPA